MAVHWVAISAAPSTLPWAEKTGNLTLRPHSVVHSVIYDEEKEKATGVQVIDSESKDVIEYYEDHFSQPCSEHQSHPNEFRFESFPDWFGE